MSQPESGSKGVATGFLHRLPPTLRCQRTLIFAKSAEISNVGRKFNWLLLRTFSNFDYLSICFFVVESEVASRLVHWSPDQEFRV